MFGAAASLLALAGCADGARAAEAECQERMVRLMDAVNGPPLQVKFEQLRRNFESMPLDGCSEGQRARIPILVRMAAELADAADTASVDRRPGPLSTRDENLTRFMTLLEGFDGRRRVMREDLEEMRAGRKHGSP